MQTLEHETEITLMKKGGLRIECKCGWWIDSQTTATNAMIFRAAATQANEHDKKGRHFVNKKGKLVTARTQLS